MKTIIYFVFTCFVGSGALLVALNSPHKLILYTVGFGVWGLFIWGCAARARKASRKRMREQQFVNYSRMHDRNR